MIVDQKTLNEVKGKVVSGIYKITNIKDGKVYIGQSKHLRHRISAYFSSETRPEWTNKITEAFRIFGSDSFKFEIVEKCDVKDLSERELYYINKYDSTNPDKGYNLSKNTRTMSCEDLKKMSESHSGLKQSAETKRKHSNLIFVITNDGKDLIICDSGKIYGDYVGKSKDYIKNCLRQPSQLKSEKKSYYLYYANKIKREEIRQKLLNKRSIRNLNFLSDISTLNAILKEGVETMYRSFDVYYLSYDNLDENGRPKLQKVSNGYSTKTNKNKFMVNKETIKSIVNFLS